MSWFSFIFGSGKSPKKAAESPKFHLSWLVPNDRIRIEYKQLDPEVTLATVINNEPEKSNLLVEVKYHSERLNRVITELKILAYDSYHLQNFSLLNSALIAELESEKQEDQDIDLIVLKSDLQQALDTENYEQAAKIRDEIQNHFLMKQTIKK